MIFLLSVLLPQLGDFHSTLHLVLEAIPLHAATPEVNHTKDVTAIELELKASSKVSIVRHQKDFKRSISHDAVCHAGLVTHAHCDLICTT